MLNRAPSLPKHVRIGHERGGRGLQSSFTGQRARSATSLARQPSEKLPARSGTPKVSHAGVAKADHRNIADQAILAPPKP